MSGKTINGTNKSELLIGSKKDDTVNGGGGNDLIITGRGQDSINGGSGHDLIFSGEGADNIDGGSGGDWIFAGKGDDTADGGSGSDYLNMGSGNDTAIFVAAENTGYHDRYVGGSGCDTLRLEFTKAEWESAAVQDDVAAFLSFIAGNPHWSEVFNFNAFGLKVSSFEKLEVVVDGVVIDPTDAPVIANDDDFAIAEGATVNGDVTNNDSVDDGVASVQLVDNVTIGNLVLNNDGTFSYDPEGAFVYLDTGETAIQTFTYEVTDVDGDTDTAEVKIVINGSGTGLPAVETSDVAAGVGGFVINGVDAYDYSGVSVSSAGDVNGDGFDDVIVGANRADPNGMDSGAAYLVFGKAGGAAVELSDIEAGLGGGYVINGIAAGDVIGDVVSAAGDVNGDGLADVIIGSDNVSPNGTFSGASYVVFGKTTNTAVELSDVAAGLGGGFVINGSAAYDYSGASVSSAGDVNGDGLDDLIVGAYGDDPNGAYSGSAYIVFGKAGTGAVNLADVEAGTGGFVINGGAAGDVAGRRVSDAGDVNGDGFDDVIVAAQYDSPNGASSGAAYVVFGKAGTSAVELADVEAGTGGFVINGGNANEQLSRSVSSAGDVNGDGLDDLIVGTDFGSTNGTFAGSSFVVFGKAGGAAVELSDVAAGLGGGFAINGAAAYDYSGFSVSSAGDMNGDGLDDLIVGAYGADPNGAYSGASYVVFGKAGLAAVELSDIASGVGGFAINGAAGGDASGFSVSAAGDVDGDGFDDVIVSSHYADPNGAQSGSSYVVFGGNFTGAATHIGTDGNDTQVGTALDDNAFGGQGDDTFTGNGGNDRATGGEGDDTFVFDNLASIVTITDFEDNGTNQDLLDVSAFGFANGGAVVALATATGPGGRDVTIQLDADDQIVLENFDLADLDASDFIV